MLMIWNCVITTTKTKNVFKVLALKIFFDIKVFESETQEIGKIECFAKQRPLRSRIRKNKNVFLKVSIVTKDMFLER